MPLSATLVELNSRANQCDSLIGNAHKIDGSGQFIFPQIDRQQITVAAFLNLFMAWESFIESAMTHLMSGAPTISGTFPTRYVTPPTQDAAKEMVRGINRYFDYANHDNVKRVAGMYFENAYPFEPQLSSIASNLNDLRTMRNASAHITSTTQKSLDALAQRVFGIPRSGIDLYSLLTSNSPTSSTGGTVFSDAKDVLLVAAELIARG